MRAEAVIQAAQNFHFSQKRREVGHPSFWGHPSFFLLN